MVGDAKYQANAKPMLRQARIAAIAVLLAAGLGSGLAAQADAKRPPECITKLIIDRQEDFTGNDSPYLKVNTKFWEVDSLKQDVWHTVFRTVHAGDPVTAYDADWPDRDDKIASDTIGAQPAPGHFVATSGFLVFVGQGAKYRAKYQAGAC